MTRAGESKEAVESGSQYGSTCASMPMLRSCGKGSSCNYLGYNMYRTLRDANTGAP